MRLGIDFGTTRVVVAAVDRGNYPVVTFETETGDASEWYPSLIAVRGDELVTGHAALAVVSDSSWSICRSFKRLLSHAGPEDHLLGLPIRVVLERFLSDLNTTLRECSNLRVDAHEPFEAAVAVPANATANQRMLTLDAFRSAGFKVVRMLDEPSAAGLEYAWRRPTDARVRKRHVAVYDLGGGTFDASIIAMSDSLHEVITTDGIESLGGHDFDEILLTLCCQKSGTSVPPAGPERDRLLETCRIEKERITAATKKLKIDLRGDGRDVAVTVTEYEEALRPLIGLTLDSLDVVLRQARERNGVDVEKSTVVYQVGGASQLPAVSRVLKDRFGRRVWRSPYAHASVAVGLAIAAETDANDRIQNRFTRHFGVWRENDSGHSAWFDTVFRKDTPLPGPSAQPPLTISRRYQAAHNVGHFRFVECSRLNESGAPAGDITPWCEVRFPLIGELADSPLDRIDVVRLPDRTEDVEEHYRCDAHGIVEVDLINHTAGYRRTFRLQGRAA